MTFYLLADAIFYLLLTAYCLLLQEYYLLLTTCNLLLTEVLRASDSHSDSHSILANSLALGVISDLCQVVGGWGGQPTPNSIESCIS